MRKIGKSMIGKRLLIDNPKNEEVKRPFEVDVFDVRIDDMERPYALVRTGTDEKIWVHADHLHVIDVLGDVGKTRFKQKPSSPLTPKKSGFIQYLKDNIKFTK